MVRLRTRVNASIARLANCGLAIRHGRLSSKRTSRLRVSRVTVSLSVLMFLTLLISPIHRRMSLPSNFFNQYSLIDRTMYIRTLVTYVYAEGLGKGGDLDQYNFNFFIKVALTENSPGTYNEMGRIDYNLIVNGMRCTPCDRALPPVLQKRKTRHQHGVVRVLKRKNTGTDFDGFNHSLEWVRKRYPLKYGYFVFINSSLRGPFMPKWTPRSFHFTDTLVQMLHSPDVHLAASYISCMAAEFEPIAGPISEALFFALDVKAIEWMKEDGVFTTGRTKTETVLGGEYGLMSGVLRRGGKVEGLNMRYASQLDWNNPIHHHCNDNRHSSRRGSLTEGLSPGVLEHVFIKSTWCVRAKETEIYSKWLLDLSDGKPGTDGRPDRDGWMLGISAEGTNARGNFMRPDVPVDFCAFGDATRLSVETLRDPSS